MYFGIMGITLENNYKKCHLKDFYDIVFESKSGIQIYRWDLKQLW